MAVGGVIGVAESEIEPLYGGKSKLTVTLKKRYVPEEKWYRLGGFSGLMTHISGNVTLDIIDDSWKFEQVTGEQLEAKEGAYHYYGSLSGKKVPDSNSHLIRKLDEMSNIIQTQETIYERAKQLSDSTARSNNLDMLEVQQQFSIIMREWGQSFNKQNEQAQMPMVRK